MARTKGTLSLASNIEPSMNAPLDGRTVVNAVADLTASGSFPYFYEGMIVSVKANHKIYQLIGNDPTVSANWEEVGSGSGGASSTDITATLIASDWDANNQQTLTFTGYDSTKNGVIGVPTSASATIKDAYAEAEINVVSISTNQFTFEAKNVPTIDLPVVLITY